MTFDNCTSRTLNGCEISHCCDQPFGQDIVDHNVTIAPLSIQLATLLEEAADVLVVVLVSELQRAHLLQLVGLDSLELPFGSIQEFAY